MKALTIIFFHLISLLLKQMHPNGTRMLIAENLALKQQLIVINRSRKRCPPLTAHDRCIFAILIHTISSKRLHKIAVILKPATLLSFHKVWVQKKYSALFSQKTSSKPGRKGPSIQVIELVKQIKTQNPRFGYLRIAMQINVAFNIKISPEAVGRILRNHFHGEFPHNTGGPSWLTFLGHLKDSLWSVDIFRCESIHLKSFWVMVVMDQKTRRIIGFAVNKGACNGKDYCRMLGNILSGISPPRYLSSDNDPLFKFKQWKRNLGILDIEEIKTVPYTPISHPFVERLIGTVRREYLDHMLFFNEQDLQKKLEAFQKYYNATRGHVALSYKTPLEVADEQEKKQSTPN